MTFLVFFMAGIDLMKEFKAEVEKLESERQELANAEKLFDLPITMYPELLEVQKDMKAMDQIYVIYEEQKVRVASEEACVGLRKLLAVFLD